MPTVLTVEFPTAALTPTVYEGSLVAVSTVVLNRASGSNVTVDYTTSDSTAAAGTDYTATAGTLTFTPGQTTQQISIPVLGGIGDADNTFYVTLSDPSGASLGSPSSQTITFTVANPVSVTNPGSQSNYDGDTVSLSVGASDALGNSLSYSASGLPSGLSINSSNGAISGTIASSADASGPYSVTVTATDSAADVSASQTFSWAVAPAYLDLFQSDQSNVAGEPVSVSLSSTAVPGHTVSYSASGLPSGLSINTSTGTVSGTVAYGDDTSSPYSVTFTATDSAADLTASTDFTWTVDTPALDILNPGNPESVVGATVDFPTAAISTDGASLTYSASGLPCGLSIDGATGEISGIIASGADAYSPYSVSVTATDAAASLSETVEFSWSVGNLTLDNPVHQWNLAGDTVTLALAASYDGCGTLVYSATGLPSGLGIDSGTGTITGTISSGAYASSPYSVTVSVGDGTYGASETFKWSVKQLILAQPSAQRSFDGEPVSVSLGVTKHAGDTVTFCATGLPAGLSINTSTGVISGTIARGDAASSPYTVAVTATDTTAGVFVSRTLQWNVDVRTQPPEPYQPLPAMPGETARAYLLRELRHAQDDLDTSQAAVTFFGDWANELTARMAVLVALNPSTWMFNQSYFRYARLFCIATIQQSYYQARVESLEAYIPIVVNLLQQFGVSFT